VDESSSRISYMAVGKTNTPNKPRIKAFETAGDVRVIHGWEMIK
jgi:hypothetical protein